MSMNKEINGIEEKDDIYDLYTAREKKWYVSGLKGLAIWTAK